MIRKQYQKYLGFAFLFAVFVLQGLYLNQKIIRLRRQMSNKIAKHVSHLKVNDFLFNKCVYNRCILPKELQQVPSSDPMIVQVKEITIRNAFAPYNPAILEQERGYLLFFRFDHLHHMFYKTIYSFIGRAILDDNLEQTQEEFITIDTGSTFSEDPRVISLNDANYLIYNDLFKNDTSRRGMHIGRLNQDNTGLSSISTLDMGIGVVEKNWPPFVVQDSIGRQGLCFEYRVANPRMILSVDSPDSPVNLQISQQKSVMQNIPWKHQWGEPLGGTPTRLLDDQYLGFFHSKFKDHNGVVWYVMGAYTFEAQPPFRLTRISPHPILFKGIYNTGYKNSADPYKAVIFPSGFAIKQVGDTTLIQLACGENDSAIKVITFDKDLLLQSLVEVQ